MDPFTQSVIASLLVNGLTATLSHVSSKIMNGKEDPKKDLSDIVAKNTKLLTIIQRAVSDFARDKSDYSDTELESLRAFVLSGDIDAIIRQMYSTHIAQCLEDNTEALRQEFDLVHSLYFPRLKDRQSKADELYDSLIEATDSALSSAIDRGYLTAHEAKSSARSRAILGEIKSIQSKLDFLMDGNPPLPADLEKFKQKLLREVGEESAYIVPPDFSSRQKVEIDKLYVTPTLEFINEETTKRTKTTLAQFISKTHRSVILGHPGNGKSTLSKKISNLLCNSYPQKNLGARTILPITVILRDYGADREERNTSILEHLIVTISTKYQIECDQEAVLKLLRDGNICVLFDGLDELLETRLRIEITDSVESFGREFPTCPIIVTSRIVGYNEAPLDDSIYKKYEISPFNLDQIQEYVLKWFGLDEDLSDEQQKSKADSFIKESRTTRDLTTNPLMLALLCNIYRGENYIPRNRSDVYEKCAIMLFEKWDKSRGLKVSLPFEAHVRPAMMHIAHWIYSDNNKQSGVTESSLVKESARYLCPKRYEDIDEATFAATAFVDFCKGRAWVFTDIGTTANGENLFQFTHRTFLEYFAASFLVRTNPDPTKLIQSILLKIKSSEWDSVTQLSCQIQNKQTEDACDNQIDELMRAYRGTADNRSKYNILSFAIRLLEFMIPKRSTIREVIGACVNECLSSSRLNKIESPTSQANPESYELESQVSSLFTSLGSVAEENVVVMRSHIKSILEDLLESPDIDNVYKAFDFSINLCTPFFGSSESYDGRITDDRAFWSNLKEELYKSHRSELLKLFERNSSAALYGISQGIFSMKSYVDHHGIAGLFSDYQNIVPPYYSTVRLLPDSLISMSMMTSKERKEPETKAYLKNWNSPLLYLQEKLPEFLPIKFESNIINSLDSHIIFAENTSLENASNVIQGLAKRSQFEFRFLTLLILIIYYELDQNRPNGSFYNSASQSNDTVAIDPENPINRDEKILITIIEMIVAPLILARTEMKEPKMLKSAEKHIKSWALNPDQENLLYEWASGTMSFTELETKR